MQLDVEITDTAQDGEEALEKAKRCKPDILLVDICMPFLNGLELIEKLYETGGNFKVIVISGYGEFEYTAAGTRRVSRRRLKSEIRAFFRWRYFPVGVKHVVKTDPAERTLIAVIVNIDKGKAFKAVKHFAPERLFNLLWNAVADKRCTGACKSHFFLLFPCK